jgi:hypothetical protein
VSNIVLKLQHVAYIFVKIKPSAKFMSIAIIMARVEIHKTSYSKRFSNFVNSSLEMQLNHFKADIIKDY